MRLVRRRNLGHPPVRIQVGENLASVPPGDVVLAPDVEAVPLNQGNLPAPGTYRFHLIVVAGNYGAGTWWKSHLPEGGFRNKTRCLTTDSG